MTVRRGRKVLPAEIKALKGNPGKRKLNFLDGEGWSKTASIPLMPSAKIPNFLTEEREREAFRTAVDDYLQRRVARTSDLSAYGRWAYYLCKWIYCKEQLLGKQTFLAGANGFKRNPLFRDMLDLERALQSLEDRLGLNPMARQSIIRGLVAMPALLESIPDEKPPEEPSKEKEPPLPEVSPLGFLQSAGKPH